MRKTSYDGADSSSITSGKDIKGKDSDTKKSAATFNKMTKSSIKRKVQNFSHESDDGIIEPLLQTDKEKIEIANRSAKYLLNKSKTESLLEKDNKVTDGYADKSSIPITVSSTSNMITHNVKESPASTSYICGSAPIHNHMNTNIFSSYEVSTGLITTKNQILVEIDNSKTGRCSPSPLIFTTAKIHTDSKTKVMEPIQVTPVPILSTIEGNIIKAGAVPCSDTKTSSLTKTGSDGIKVLSGKPEVNTLQNDKDKIKSPSVAHAFLKSEALNENVKKLATTTSSLESSANLIYQSKKLGQLSNTEISPAAANLTSSKNTSLKEQPLINITTTQTNISITDTIEKTTEKSTSASSSNNTSGKYSSIEKSKENFHTLGSKDSKILPEPLNLQNQDNVQKINLETPEHQKTFFNSKDIEFGLNTSVPSNKKLHRQKNASNEATNDSVNTILKKDTQKSLNQIDNNLTSKTVKVPKQENKSDFAPRDTLPIATKVLSISTLTSAHAPNNSITVSSSTEMKDIVLVSTPKVKSIPETVNSKPTLSDVCKVVTKSQTKSSVTTTQTDVKDIKESATMSSKPTSSALSSSKLTAVSVSAKPDILSSSPRFSHSVKTNPSINSTVTTVNTPLPSYIVPTSKTKIGLTMTSNTPAVTLKSQIQKPIVNVHTTSAFVTSGAKTSSSSSDANGTKHTVFSKQAKTNAETIKKDGRA